MPSPQFPRFVHCSLALLLCGLAFAASGSLRVAMPFQDNMVLQRGMPLPVWGTAGAGERVTVKFAGQTVTATAGADGGWNAVLPPLTASLAPAEMTIAGVKDTLTLKNVLVGEVWLCSGQSNMELTVARCQDADKEKAAANYPAIRHINAGQKRWDVCSPETVGNFTAAGYFFARELYTRLHVPVGLINASAGGTPIQGWTIPASAKSVPALKSYWEDIASQMQQAKADPKAWQQRYTNEAAKLDTARDAWEQQTIEHDLGITGQWADPATATKDWYPMTLPMPDADAALNTVGTVWMRREAQIPPAWVGKALTLNIGPIDEMDNTYVNGKKVGRIWRDTPDFWRIPRRYPIPTELNTSTHVTVAIQVYNLIGMMGLFGKPEQYALQLAEDPAAPPVSLAGAWQMREGACLDIGAMPRVPFMQNPGPDGEYGGLFHAYIAPFVHYGIKGALWYQGENNAPEPDLYAALLPAMVRGWREAWGQGDFAFYSVQLAGHQGRQRFPVEHNSWAEVREAQGTVLILPHAGLVVITDIGDAGDIHPKNKQDVGKRLARWALAKDYGMKMEYSGPQLAALRIRGDRVELRFTHAKRLCLAGNVHAGFAIAGADKTFHPALAKVKGNTVVVTAADGQVPKPVAVRYAWAFHPACFLYNADHLPASQFRTDAWPRAAVK